MMDSNGSQRGISAALCAITVAALTACGGGGGADTAGTGGGKANSVGSATYAGSSLVTSVPPATYSAVTQTEEQAAFTYLNAERSHCGFGVLAHNRELDATAQGHSDWQLRNDTQAHYQVLGTPGFTGVTPMDRATAAGFGAGTSYGVGEVIMGRTGDNTKLNFGVFSVRGLLNAPYHEAGLLAGTREVGISVRNGGDIGLMSGTRVVTTINTAFRFPQGMQLMSSSDIQTYPCEGSTGIDRMMQGETPNPVPGRDLYAKPLGSSIYIGVRYGQTLSIANASMVKASTGAAVQLRAPMTATNDPHGHINGHEALVSADAPLAPNTPYLVTINGSNNGITFSRSFTFVTGI